MVRSLAVFCLLLALTLPGWAQNWQPLRPGVTYLHRGPGDSPSDGPNYVVADSTSPDSSEVYLNSAWWRTDLDSATPDLTLFYKRQRANYLGTYSLHLGGSVWLYYVRLGSSVVAIPVDPNFTVGRSWVLGPITVTLLAREADTVLGQPDMTMTWSITSADSLFTPRTAVFSRDHGIVQFPQAVGQEGFSTPEFWVSETDRRRVYRQIPPGRPNPLPIHAQAWAAAQRGARIDERGHEETGMQLSYRSAFSLHVDSVQAFSADSVAVIGTGVKGVQSTYGGRPPDTAQYTTGSIRYVVETHFAARPELDAWHILQASYNGPAAGNPSGDFSFLPTGNYFMAGGDTALRRTYSLAWPFMYHGRPFLKLSEPLFEGTRSISFRQGPGIDFISRAYIGILPDNGLWEISCYTPAGQTDTCPSIRPYLTAARPALRVHAQAAPNPFSSTLTLSAPAPFRYELRAVDGRLYLAGSSNANEAAVQAASLPPGLYQALLFTDSAKPLAVRVVKTR